MAEAILKHLVLKRNLQDWYVDSAGLRDWNVDEEPQARGQQLLKQHGLKTNHLGRMVHTSYFKSSHHLVIPNSFCLDCFPRLLRLRLHIRHGQQQPD